MIKSRASDSWAELWRQRFGTGPSEDARLAQRERLLQTMPARPARPGIAAFAASMIITALLGSAFGYLRGRASVELHPPDSTLAVDAMNERPGAPTRSRAPDFTAPAFLEASVPVDANDAFEATVNDPGDLLAAPASTKMRSPTSQARGGETSGDASKRVQSRKLAARELMQQADAARFARDVPRARAILLRLRTRYPGAPEARLAAFLLGRIAYELEQDDIDAARWFGIYLDESPRGELARAAAGRRLLALRRVGSTPDALVRAAKDYLARAPDGPYEQLARELLRAGASGARRR